MIFKQIIDGNLEENNQEDKNIFSSKSNLPFAFH